MKKISLPKRFLSILLSLLMIVSTIFASQITSSAASAGVLTNPNATQKTQEVYKFIYDIYKGGQYCISGQQESTWTATDPCEYEMKYIERVTGKLPALRGFDYIDNDFEGVNKRAIEWWNKGGLVTICWHTGADYNSGYDKSKSDSFDSKMVVEGTTAYNNMIAGIDKAAGYLKQLQDAGVTVLWRPYHEFDGKWFWWGKNGYKDFKKLWQIMYDRYTNYWGLNNLIWVLGYSKQNAAGLSSTFTNWYPGDNYVDIIGADTYADPSAKFFNEYTNLWKKMTGMKKDMPIALHECGNIPTVSQWNNMKWTFFMTWHTGWIDPTYDIGSDTGKYNSDTSKLIETYNSETVITLDELPDFIITGSQHTHTASTPVKENEIAPTCTNAGTYDEVVYCSECNEEISRNQNSTGALGHDIQSTENVSQKRIERTCSRASACGLATEYIPLDDFYAARARLETEIQNTEKYVSVESLKQALTDNELNVETDTITTLNEKITAIQTAINTADVKSFTVDFYAIDANEKITQITEGYNAKYNYDGLVTFKVPDNTPYKWIKTVAGEDTLLANTAEEVSVVIRSDMKIYACCEGEEASQNQHRITICNKSNKPVDYVFVNSGAELSFEDGKLIVDGEIINLDKLPFYQIAGVKIGTNEIENGTYTVSSDIEIKPIYQAQSNIVISLASNNISFSDLTESSKIFKWGEKVVVATKDNSEVIWCINGIDVSQGSSYTFRASNSVDISVKSVDSEVVNPSSIITFSYFDSESYKAKYVVSNFQSIANNYEIEEQGIFIGTSKNENATFTKDTIINYGKKYIATNINDTGDQFSYSVSMSKTTTVKTICAVSYVKYKNISTPIYSDIVYLSVE